MKVYTEQELQELLNLSPRQTKALMRAEGFPSVKIGSVYRVKEDRLNEWLDSIDSIKLNCSEV